MTRKTVPRFRTEDEEREFWAKADSTDYLDWSKARRAIFPNLRPSTRTISLRLPESVIEAMKLLANKRDVPYQSLMKMFLVERIATELPFRGRRRGLPKQRVRPGHNSRRVPVR
jgi:predicted DNA binding CopG/RHH family protein